MKRLGFLFLCLLIFLSGCVRYDLGMNFAQANKGTIIQHIKLDEQLTNFSESSGNTWLKSIEMRAIQLQGKTKRISPNEIVVTIPFNNGQDLVSKFNKFFNNSELNKTAQNKEFNDLLDLKAEMSIQQSNLVFFERNILNVSADLSPLGVISEEGNVIISSGELIDLQLKFNFPWGAKPIENSLLPSLESSKNQYIWQLQPGKVNQIKTVFLLPNYIGLGTLAIALFIIFGFYLKYKKLPFLN
jgi:hypothetical protein